MRLHSKFTLGVSGVLVVVIAAGGMVWYSAAKDQVLERARSRMAIMRDLADAVQSHVRDVQHPEVAEWIGQDRFIPEAQSATVVARDVFARFAKTHRGFSFRESSDNPLNPESHTDAFEDSLLVQFRADRQKREIADFKIEHGEEEWYVSASPIVAVKSCLKCHDTPEVAPRDMVAVYGRSHGFGWREGDVVGVLSVKVPTTDIRAAQTAVAWTVAGWTGLISLAAIAAVAVAARIWVCAPAARMARQMRRAAVERDYSHRLDESTRRDELGTAAAAFNDLLGVVASTIKELHDTQDGLEQRVMERTAELRESRERFELFMDHGPMLAFVKDENFRFVYVNRRCRERFAIDGDAWHGKTVFELFPQAEAQHLHENDLMVMATGLPHEFIEEVNSPDGASTHWMSLKFPLTDDKGRRSLAGMVIDLTEQRRAERDLAHQASHDALTGLPNRKLFGERVVRCLERAQREPGNRFTLMFIDLDGFKLINDGLGHAIGDQLLIETARSLEHCLAGIGNAGVTVARMGGDEFLILLEGVSDNAGAEAAAQRVVTTLSGARMMSGHELTTAASVGVVVAGGDYRGADELLRDADVAMYRAKSKGKGRYVLFDAAMHESALRRLRLEAELRRAIERDELVLHYQPVISLTDRTLMGFEALLRWRRGGVLVSPLDFIPIAEDTGLIVPIGAWVVREACRQLRAWRDARADWSEVTVAVNVSVRQLVSAQIFDDVQSALDAAGLPPSALKLEITESVVMHDLEGARQILGRLRAMGVRVMMDDFGTGYSSLGCLNHLSLDGLKIDRTFIRDVAGRRDAVAVLRAIVELAHNMGMTVVAEGLETPEQVALLQTLDCDYGQGYLFAKPLSAEDAVRYESRAMVGVA